jgi:alkanesulfonate monooxygenase SsuD/methylene tetrahydromethanopterin reductase-like flavin-dependent oxidoreductase (luciferase family)
VRYAVDIPNFGYWAEPRRMAEFAAGVEQAGWDGLSLWDHILGWDGNEVADPWVLLTIAATATERITLISMVTPLPRRHPWKLARETVSVDLLSGGRLVLGVGTGYPPEDEFGRFGLPVDDRTRADQLDEGLEVLTGLWTGEPFTSAGDHYQVGPVTFLPTPLQQPRIPIWVAGMWPARRPFRRAARWDGVAPIVFEDGAFRDIAAADLEAILALIAEHRSSPDPFEVAVSGSVLSGGAAGRDHAASLAAAGATWWREGWNPASGMALDTWIERIMEGPPR